MMFMRVSATEENLSTLCYGGALLQTPPHKTLQQTYCTHPHTRHCIAARKTLQQTNRHCNRRIDTNAPQRIRRIETNAPQRMTMDILCRVSCVMCRVSCVVCRVSCALCGYLPLSLDLQRTRHVAESEQDLVKLMQVQDLVKLIKLI